VPKPVAPPAPVSASVACSNYREVVSRTAYPRQARRLGLTSGEALIQFTLTAGGEIRNVTTLRATHRTFARASAEVVQQFRCKGLGREVLVNVPFSYRLE
jgi:protein TonB